MLIFSVASSFSVLLRRDAAFAAVTWTRLLTASSLLQQIAKASRGLYRRLYSFLGRPPHTGAVPMAVIVVAVVVMRLVLVDMRLLLWV